MESCHDRYIHLSNARLTYIYSKENSVYQYDSHRLMKKEKKAHFFPPSTELTINDRLI